MGRVVPFPRKTRFHIAWKSLVAPLCVLGFVGSSAVVVFSVHELPDATPHESTQTAEIKVYGVGDCDKGVALQGHMVFLCGDRSRTVLVSIDIATGEYLIRSVEPIPTGPPPAPATVPARRGGA